MYADKYYAAKYDEVYPAVYEEMYESFYQNLYEELEKSPEAEGLTEQAIDERCRTGAQGKVKAEAQARMNRWLTLETARQPAIMTLTHASWMYEKNETANFYALACGSTSFASNEILNNAAYGNRDVLFSAVYLFSRNVMPYDIDVVAVENPSSLAIKDGAATAWLVVLSVVIPMIALSIGIAVTVRRKKHN